MLFGNPSLFTRIAIGKGVGFLFGLAGLLAMPYFWPEASWSFRIGILFWYATVGAIIAVYGVFTWHPVLRLPMPWWIRAPIIGAWMNLLLVLLASQELTAMMLAALGGAPALTSPYWLVLEGAIVGLIIGFFCTRFGGEGKAALSAMKSTAA